MMLAHRSPLCVPAKAGTQSGLPPSREHKRWLGTTLSIYLRPDSACPR